MSRGTPQAELLLMLKAECGIEMDSTVAPADNTRYIQLLNNQQKWLINQHSFLLGKVTADVTLTSGTRYYDFPETVIDIDRVDKPAFVRYGRWRYPLRYGIMQSDFNAWDSENGQSTNPILRWQLINVSGDLQIEVWPLPGSVDQTLVLTGYEVLNPISDTQGAVVDDMVLVLFTAAEILAREKEADAPAKLARAQAALASLRGSQGSRFEHFNMAGKPIGWCGGNRVVVVSGDSGGGSSSHTDTWDSGQTMDGSQNF